MKAIIISALSIILSMTVSFGQKTETWETIVVHKNGERNLAKFPQIKVISQNEKQTKIKIINNTGIDLIYAGYAKRQPVLFNKKLIKGKWVATSWEMCATGIENHTLKKGSSLTIKIGSYKLSQVYTMMRNAKDAKEWSLVKLYENGKK